MTSGVLDSNGKSGKTNSPGETTCNDAGCHSGNPLNDGVGSIQITSPNLLNWQYEPGKVYTINVTVSRTGSSLFGFDFEALTSTGANAGIITATDLTKTQLANSTVLGNSRRNIFHKLNGGSGSNGTHSFTFNWTAPVTNIGNVTFYAAGNATNNNGNRLGDFIYTTSQMVTSASVGIFENVISTNQLNIYPNPIIETAKISYQLNNNAKVSASLVALNGAVVSVFFNEFQTPGEQTKELEIGTSIIPGVYLFVLDVGGVRNVKQLVVK
jgi:hypothetical protein